MTASEYKDRCRLRINADSATVGLLERQWSEATAYIDSPSRARTVTCGCGRRPAIELTFRCYFCGIFFCDPCAREHFGEEARHH